MSDYSYQDMMRMQSEAKQRVLEMQKRSRYAAERFNGKKSQSSNGDIQSGEEELPRKPKTISYPAELQAAPQRKNHGNRHGKTGGIDIRKTLASVFGNLSDDEYEKMFILSLCVLLAKEQGDDSLIFALMYLLT